MSALDAATLKKLPDAQRQILQRAMEQKFIAVHHDEANALNSAIDSLPKPDRDRIIQLASQCTILSFSRYGLPAVGGTRT